jgi:hypothetical protein
LPPEPLAAPPPVPVENLVRTGHTACSYSLSIPRTRCVLRTFSWALWLGERWRQWRQRASVGDAPR